MNRFYFSFILSILLFFAQRASSQYYNAIDWGTYFNDNAHFPDFSYQHDDWCTQIAIDQNDPVSIYITGKTKAAANESISFCSGSHIIELGTASGFLAKYDACGELKWSAYFGDYTYCLALDEEAGKKIIYVAGSFSTDNNAVAFSCDGSSSPLFQPYRDDNGDAFIAKYEDDDTSVTLLRWTYFGGTSPFGPSSPDPIYTMDIHKHHLYVAGSTQSVDLYKGAHHFGDTTYGGKGDGYVAEFDSMLSKLQFFTYVGGTGNDRCHDIKVSEQASGPVAIYASGTAASNSGIASGSGFDLTANGGTDGFLCKWEDDAGDGSFMKTWGTYIGGSSGEHSRQMAVDSAGNAFVTGFGTSHDLPVTPFAYDKYFGKSGASNTGKDAYVIKVGSNGSKVWCTYFGGNKDEVSSGLALLKNASGQFVIISGVTRSTGSNFNLVYPIQNLLNGNNTNQYYDAFISILSDVSATQQQLVFSTYIGGSNEEGINTGQYYSSLAVGAHGELYFAAPTKSSDINSVVGSEFQDLIQPYTGGSDVLIAKLIDLNNSAQMNCPPFKMMRKEDLLQDDGSAFVHIFPNPFHDKLIAQINSASDEQSELNIFNAYGQLMWNEKVEIRPGVNQFPLELKNYPNGIYQLSFRLNGKVISGIFLKQ